MSLTPRERAIHYATRNKAFTVPTAAHLQHLSTILSQPCPTTQRKGKILTSASDIEPYNIDWMKQVQGVSPAVLLPTHTQQVAAILQYCQKEKLAVVPQSGNTGLVYGQGPVHDELVLSTRLMNAEPVVSRETMSVECESGVILQQCQKACADQGLLFPLSMGSRGSALIGGCVSTNAGGIHYARYGSMHANVLGVEAVTATGQVLNLLSTLRKDNAGYDLKQLFIGSEGTLGVVTRAAIKVYPQPRSQQLALFKVATFTDVLRLNALAQEHLAECLSAFEVMDAESLLTSPDTAVPFKKANKAALFDSGSDMTAAYFAVLVETNGSNTDHDFEKLSGFVEAAQEITQAASATTTTIGCEAEEAILSQSETQTAALWGLREDVPVRLASSGLIYKYDVSFPLNRFYAIVEFTRELLYKKHKLPASDIAVVGYGHFGDGNVHLNIVDRTRTHQAALDEALYPAVYEYCAQHGGSISAEHGVGMQKREYLSLSRAPEVIGLMRDLKMMMDPAGILNPYKVLPIGEGGH